MPKYLNKAAMVQCAHQGAFVFTPGGSFVLNGSEILLKRDVLAANIAACTWVGPGKVPCTKVVSISRGPAGGITIDGDQPILDTIRVVTNGNGPGQVMVIANPTTDAQTGEEAEDQDPVPDSDDWDVTNLKWSQDKARDDNKVKLLADAKNVPGGTRVVAEIYEFDSDGDHDFVCRLDPVVVQGQSISIPWVYKYHADVDAIPTEEEAREDKKHYEWPEYFFTLRVLGRSFGHEGDPHLLRYQDFVEVQVVDEATKKPIKGLRLDFVLADGSTRSDKTNEDGRCKLDDVPPGRCTVTIRRSDDDATGRRPGG